MPSWGDGYGKDTLLLTSTTVLMRPMTAPVVGARDCRCLYLGSTLTNTIALRPPFIWVVGFPIELARGARYLIGPGKQEEYADQEKPNRPQDVPNDHDICGQFEPGRFKRSNEYASSRHH